PSAFKTLTQERRLGKVHPQYSETVCKAHFLFQGVEKTSEKLVSFFRFLSSRLALPHQMLLPLCTSSTHFRPAVLHIDPALRASAFGPTKRTHAGLPQV